MKLLISVCIFAIINAFSCCYGEVPAYKCEIEDDFCTFWNVDLNETNYRFFPRADRPQTVERVRFYNSNIDVFGPDVCHAFTKLKVLEAYFADVQRITEDAFDSCPNLEKIDFRYHKLTELKPDTFKKTPKLQFLRLDAGELQQLPMKIFSNLTNLTALSLADNKLGLFPAQLVKDLKNLTELWLYSNELKELDERGLIANLPKLQKIYINDNDLKCARIQPIVKAFQEKGVQGLSYMSVRQRHNQVSKVLDIECLNEQQWNLINNEKGWKMASDDDTQLEHITSEQAQSLFAAMGTARMKGICAQFCSDDHYPTY